MSSKARVYVPETLLTLGKVLTDNPLAYFVGGGRSLPLEGSMPDGQVYVSLEHIAEMKERAVTPKKRTFGASISLYDVLSLPHFSRFQGVFEAVKASGLLQDLFQKTVGGALSRRLSRPPLVVALIAADAAVSIGHFEVKGSKTIFQKYEIPLEEFYDKDNGLPLLPPGHFVFSITVPRAFWTQSSFLTIGPPKSHNERVLEVSVFLQRDGGAVSRLNVCFSDGKAALARLRDWETLWDGKSIGSLFERRSELMSLLERQLQERKFTFSASVQARRMLGSWLYDNIFDIL